MIIKRTLFLCVVVFSTFFYAACDDTSPVALDDVSATLNSAQKGAPFAGVTPQAIEGEYMVVLKETVAAAEVDALAAGIAEAHGGEVRFVYRHVLKGFAVSMPASAVNAVSVLSDVAYVEQSQVAYGSSVAVADTQLAAPWHLDRIDQRALPLNSKYGYSLDGTGVTAYVIDSGMDLDHGQFGGRASLGADLVDPLDGGEDCNGHGTHVAGILGSATYGVAKDVTLKAIRVFDCNNAGTIAGVIAGLDTTVAMASGPSVANLSMAGVGSQALEDAVENLVAEGIPIAVSIGDLNNANCGTAPGSSPSAFTVAATDINDRRTSTSSYGTCVDFFAPGEDIVSTWLAGGTNMASGTSQAAPHVAGVIALYLEAEPTAPPLSPTVASVADVLFDHATIGVVTNPGAGSPNRFLFSDVPNNPRTFDLTLENARIKANGKGEGEFSWDPATVFTSQVDLYVDEAPDGTPKKTTSNDGSALLKFNNPGNGPFDVQACEHNSTVICSDIVSVSFTFTIRLKQVFFNQNGTKKAVIKWDPTKVNTNKIDFYIEDTLDIRTQNDGKHKLKITLAGDGPFEIYACEKNSTTECSNSVFADFSGAVVIYEPDPDSDEGE